MSDSTMDRLRVSLLFLLFNTPVQAVSTGHSFVLLITYIQGETAFPEFTAVAMTDNVQVAYFDSKTNTVYRVENLQHQIKPENYYDISELIDTYNYVRTRLPIFLKRFNITEGGHVYQRRFACQTSADGESNSLVIQQSLDAIDLDSYHCNKTHYSSRSGDTWQSQWEENSRLLYRRMALPNIYFPLCIQYLHYSLKTNRKLLLRRVHPRVRFLQKEIPGGAKATCLATDFYPRDINLTLLRDGKPVAEQQLTGGSVLPNGNGLYQVRKSLELSSVELREKHSYTCVASHLSVDNRLEVTWQPSGGRSYKLLVLSVPLLLGLLLALLLLVLGCWRMRRMGEKRKNADIVTSLPLRASEDDNQMDKSSL